MTSTDTLTFFFWNLARRPLVKELAHAVKEHTLDIVVLAESELRDQEILAEIPSLSKPVTYSDKIQIYTRGDPSQVVPVFDDPARRLTIRRLLFPSQPDILLAAVHFFDKQNWTEADQMAQSILLADDIVRTETKLGHTRTLLVGDLNMHPFDKGVVAAAGLHGVMTRSIAREQTRTVAKQAYRFFYNPMWSFLGERQSGPPGTNFYRKSVQVLYFWNILDQVLLRPDLMDSLIDLRILDELNGRSLLNKAGRPVVSDHLPLLFRLKLTEGETGNV